MSAAMVQLIITLVELLIVQFPSLAAGFQKIFASGNPTPADFANLRAEIAAENYGQFVPASQLPANETGGTAVNQTQGT
jgi:hypothetical protein